MSPVEKGELLLRHVEAQEPVRGLDFRHAKAKRLDLRRANLEGADLRDADFYKSNLSEARLDDANLEWAYLSDVDFSGANLARANLGWARMSGTCLLNARLDDAILRNARLTAQTYERSAWTPAMLVALQQRGIELVDLQKFPRDARLAVVGPSEGLFLYFNKTLTPIDHLMVQGIVAAYSTRGDACRLSRFEETGHDAVVVIEASNQRVLQEIASSLYERARLAGEGARQQQLAEAEHRGERNALVALLNSVLNDRLATESLPIFLEKLDLASIVTRDESTGGSCVTNLHIHGDVNLGPVYNTTVERSNVGALVIGAHNKAVGAVKTSSSGGQQSDGDEPPSGAKGQ